MLAKYNSLNDLTAEIVDSAFQVHKEIGPGLLESIYKECMTEELISRNLKVVEEVLIPIIYKGKLLTKDFRLDLLIENEIIVEIKAVETLNPVFKAQLISYLKLTNKKIGFLINFNVELIKNGIRRYVNNFP